MLFFFGGTFDPPHHGHRALVRRLLQEFPHAKVIVSPAAFAPLRSDERLFSYRERFALLRVCFKRELERGQVILSVLEKSLPKPNYTIETLAHLSRRCGEKPIVVIGADQAAKIGNWHRSDELLREYRFVVFARGKEGKFLDDHAWDIMFFKDFDEPISATELRVQLVQLPREHRFAAALKLLTDEV